MPYASKAQQGYFHAALARGEMKPSTVHEFDKATSHKAFERLPEHVKHAAHGGLMCMHCGGEVDDEGSTLAQQYGGDEHDYDGDDDGNTAQSEEQEYRRAKALFHDAIRRR